MNEAIPMYQVGDRVLICHSEGHNTSLHRVEGYGGKRIVVELPTVYAVKSVVAASEPGECVYYLVYAGPDDCIFPVLDERVKGKFLEREASL